MLARHLPDNPEMTPGTPGNPDISETKVITSLI